MFPFSAQALPDNKKTTGQPSKPTCRNFKKPSAKISENPIKIRFEFRKVVLISSVPPKRNPLAGHLGPSSPFECTRLLCTIVDFSK